MVRNGGDAMVLAGVLALAACSSDTDTLEETPAPGESRLQAFLRITLPLLAPGLVASGAVKG